MVKEGFMSKVGFNLELKEWMRDEQIEQRKEGVVHKQTRGGGQRVLCSVAGRRIVQLKSLKG